MVIEGMTFDVCHRKDKGFVARVLTLRGEFLVRNNSSVCQILLPIAATFQEGIHSRLTSGKLGRVGLH